MSPGISLIVGLGNPGEKYENTRHNAGAWLIERLATHDHVTLHPAVKFHGLHGTIKLKTHDCHLLIPTKYMNLSGQAVKAVASYYKIPAENILIAHDEIDLPVGDIRLKFDGGHGGHNGLRDIINQLGTNKFYRLRIGVGHPGNREEVEHYVLNPPKKSEREQITTAIQRAEDIIPFMLNGEFQKAMMTLHTKG